MSAEGRAPTRLYRAVTAYQLAFRLDSNGLLDNATNCTAEEEYNT